MEKLYYEQLCNGSTSTINSANGLEVGLPSVPPAISIPSRCCASLQVQQLMGAGIEGALHCDTSLQLFVLWVLFCRNQDPHLEEEVKRSCPLAGCTHTSDYHDINFTRHIAVCSALKFGEYSCPYHNHQTERFMVSQKKRTWYRKHELREAVYTCTRRICRGFSRPASSASTLSDYANAADATIYGHYSAQADRSYNKRRHIDGSTNLIYENQMSINTIDPVKMKTKITGEPSSKKMEPVDDIRSNTEFDPYLPTSISRPCYHSLRQNVLELGVDTFHELGSDSRSSPALGPSEMSAGNDHLWTANNLLMDPDDHVSMEDFNNPPSQQAIAEWRTILLSCARSGNSLDTSLNTSMSQKQGLHPSTSRLTTREYPERRRSKSSMLPPIDTSGYDSRMTLADLSSSAPQHVPSTLDDPEILRLAPDTFVGDLMTQLFKMNCKSVAFLSITPRSDLSSQISSNPPSAARVYESGWMAVKKILEGGFPTDVKSLFFLAQLAVSCTQAVQENPTRFHLDRLQYDLEQWASNLPIKDQEVYIELVSSILGPETSRTRNRQSSRRMSAPYSTTSSSRSNRWTYLSSLSAQERQQKLKDGIAIHSCFQYLEGKRSSLVSL